MNKLHIIVINLFISLNIIEIVYKVRCLLITVYILRHCRNIFWVLQLFIESSYLLCYCYTDEIFPLVIITLNGLESKVRVEKL